MSRLHLHYPACPIRNVLDRIGDKWSLLVLCTLATNPKMRYKHLIAAVPDISYKMMTTTLRRLEEDKLINRKAYAEIPPRVEYSLTEIGKSFMPVIEAMIKWADENFETVTYTEEKAAV